MHNVLGFDHQNPDNLCARASRDTRQTGWGAVKRVRRAAGGAFEATDVSGKTFHCLFCHGFEKHGQKSVGVLATGLIATDKMGAHMAHMALCLAGRIVFYKWP
ncbi:hypothetical protein VUR80DRAFT_5119 [Thermomyces stellatus]